MNKRMMCLTLAVTCLLASAVAIAEPFDAKTVPADAKWVLHVDGEAIQKSAAWPMIQQRLDGDPNIVQKIKEFRAITKMSFPQDFFSLTIYGASFDEKEAVVIVRARADQQQILNLLQLNPGYAAEAFGTHDVLSWEDNGKVMFGAFADGDSAVISQSKENVQKALSVKDGKALALAADSGLAQLGDAGVIVGVAGHGVAELARKHKAESPLVNLIESASITAGADQQNVLLKAKVSTVDAQKAEQMRGALEGLKNMALLMIGNNKQDARAEIVTGLLPALKVTAAGSAVQLEWPLPIADVKRLVEAVRQPKAALAPAAEPAQ